MYSSSPSRRYWFQHSKGVSHCEFSLEGQSIYVSNILHQMFAYVPQTLHLCLLLMGTSSFVGKVSFFVRNIACFHSQQRNLCSNRHRNICWCSCSYFCRASKCVYIRGCVCCVDFEKRNLSGPSSAFGISKNGERVTMTKE